MEIDLKAGTVTFRILYLGPEGATKYTNLRGLHAGAREAERSDLRVMHLGGDRLVAVPLKPRDLPPWRGLKVIFQAMALPGRIRRAATEMLLLQTADAVIFLPDRKQPAGRATRRAFSQFVQRLATLGPSARRLPVLVPDYQDAEPPLRHQALSARGQACRVRFVPVEGDTVEGIHRVFALATRAILSQTGNSAGSFRTRGFPPRTTTPGRRPSTLSAIGVLWHRQRMRLWILLTFLGVATAAWCLTLLA